jgi:hypothetical protein
MRRKEKPSERGQEAERTRSDDEIRIDGSIEGRDCLVEYRQGGRALAFASIYRDLANLQRE